MLIWTDPAVQAALIESVGNLLTAIIATTCAALIGQQISDRRRLKERLSLAQNDIAFLLAVEEEHCNLHKEAKGQTLKQTVRKSATERGITWSGKFTPGRVKFHDSNS